MNAGASSILTINGGSSSIRFALYEATEPLQRGLSGTIDRIGLRGTNLTFSGLPYDPRGTPEPGAPGSQIGGDFPD
jgi:hypothetical protein